MSELIQDVRYAVQQLLKNPGITFVALLSVALGIGATAAILSLMDTVMRKSLPVKEPARLVLLGDGKTG
jgi:macrolide transport system ATP-binding/permease protein